MLLPAGMTAAGMKPAEPMPAGMAAAGTMSVEPAPADMTAAKLQALKDLRRRIYRISR